jgi:hypothetical protein
MLVGANRGQRWRTINKRPRAYPEVMKPQGLGATSLSFDNEAGPAADEGDGTVIAGVGPFLSLLTYEISTFPLNSSRTAWRRVPRAAANESGIDLRASMSGVPVHMSVQIRFG